jgi:hypothetical protein
MVSAEFFTAVERGARAVRGNASPFGGVQLVRTTTQTLPRSPARTTDATRHPHTHAQQVCCGDFFQLPPISKRPSPDLPKDAFLNRGFAFQSPVWNKCEMQSVILTKGAAMHAQRMRAMRICVSMRRILTQACCPAHARAQSFGRRTRCLYRSSTTCARGAARARWPCCSSAACGRCRA